jgi:hypothetical protein
MKAVARNVITEREPVIQSAEPIYLTQAEQEARQHIWGKKNLAEVDKACLHGAEAKVTLRVIDSKGRPVPEAEVKVAFSPRDPKEAGKKLTGFTDKEGLFVATGKTTYDIFYSACKTNFYLTVRKYPFYWRGTECVKDGRWIPWNPTLEVVLKEKRKSIPMYTKIAEVILPEQDKPFGYDMQAGDLVEPYGKGKYRDIVLTYFFNYPKDISAESISRLCVATSQPNDGISLNSKDTWSDFKSLHEAPENGYSTNLLLITRYNEQKLVEKKEVSQNDYLIVKSRVKMDNEGRIISANYGKIYGEIIYGGTEKNLKGGMVRLCYYFNPTPNDRNLEFDCKNNLFNMAWGDSWPREP